VQWGEGDDDLDAALDAAEDGEVLPLELIAILILFHCFFSL